MGKIDFLDFKSKYSVKNKKPGQPEHDFNERLVINILNEAFRKKREFALMRSKPNFVGTINKAQVVVFFESDENGKLNVKTHDGVSPRKPTRQEIRRFRKYLEKLQKTKKIPKKYFIALDSIEDFWENK